MTLPRSAADVLARHVVFELECIDRVYCNLYVPKLQRDLGVVGFIREHLGMPVASTAALAEEDRGVLRRGPRVRRRQGHPGGGLQVRAAQGRRDARAARAVPGGGPHGGRGVHRAGAGEGERVGHDPAAGRGGELLPVDRPGEPGGHPVVLLLPRRLRRAVLHQVLRLLPLQRQAVLQRQRVREMHGGPGWDRVHAAGQRVRRRR